MTVYILAIVAILLVILFVWLLLREQGERTAVGPSAGVKSESRPAAPAVPVAAPVVPASQAVLIEPEPAPIPVVEPVVESKPVEKSAPVAAVQAPAAQPAAPVIDDLEIIEGIGPKIAAALKQAGVTRFEQLAGMDPARISAILHAANLRLADPKSWPEQARLAAAGDQAGLKALQDRLKGGREI